MRVKLEHPRVLHDGKPGSEKLLQKGQHDISEAVASHWYTKQLLKTGDISMIAESDDEKKEKAAEAKKAAKAEKEAEEAAELAKLEAEEKAAAEKAEADKKAAADKAKADAAKKSGK